MRENRIILHRNQSSGLNVDVPAAGRPDGQTVLVCKQGFGKQGATQSMPDAKCARLDSVQCWKFHDSMMEVERVSHNTLSTCLFWLDISDR